jgi:hypothetical protein
VAHDRGGLGLLCAQTEDDAVFGRTRGEAFKAMGRGYQARINRILGTWMEMKIGHVMEAEKIMLSDRRRAILDAEQAEGSETAGRGWAAYGELKD